MSATQGTPDYPQVLDAGRANVPLSGDGSGNPSKSDPPTKPGGVEGSIRDTNLLKGIGAGARVWATYIQEANKYDDELVGGWNRDLDVTLVFAALFSAVVTAFVFESVKLLQPDLDSANTAALMDISQVLRRMAAGQPLPLEQPEAPDIAGFRPTGYSVCINVLFFSSLSLSVAVSLAAMVAKQWCYHFVSGRTGDSIKQVEVRQARLNEIERWRMGGILEMLPILMHLSLGIFWVGLVLYMWDIHLGVAVAVTTIAGITMCFYFGTMALPIVVEHCPFITPQGEWVGSVIKNLGTPITQPIGSFASTCTRKFHNPSTDPHTLGNGSKLAKVLNRISRWSLSAARVRSPTINGDIRPEGMRWGLNLGQNWLAHRPSHGEGSATTATTQGVLSTERQERETGQQALINEQGPSFIGDSLLWLIKNSRDSTAIDLAIGALVIGKIDIQMIRREQYNFKRQICSYLAKRLSECFESHEERGAKLVLSIGSMGLSSALDYSRWMSYFVGSKLDDIKQEILELNDTLGVELVAHLGLAFASLCESQGLSHGDGTEIAMWLCVFVDLYDEQRLFTRRAISVIIDGLTAVGLKLTIPSGADNGNQRKPLVNNLGIAHLVKILSAVSSTNDPQDTRIHSSIVLNLTAFALRAKFAYPFDHKGFESLAHQLVEDHHAGILIFKNETYSLLTAFSLIGLIHPKSGLGLTQDTATIISKLIRKLDIFRSDFHCTSDSLCHITSPDSFRQHMAAMLVSTMMRTNSTRDSPLHWSFGGQLETPASVLQSTSMSNVSGAWKGDLEFPSTLLAVCKLMHDHLDKTITLHPETLVGATELLLQEVKQLSGFKIDYETLFPPQGTTAAPLKLESSQFTEVKSGEDPTKSASVANATLSRIMEEPKDPRCFEAVVHTIIHYSDHCSVDSVSRAIAWIADRFQHDVPNRIQKEEERLLRVSGYARVLASMVRHCPNLKGLSGHINRLVSSESDRKAWGQRLTCIRRILNCLCSINPSDHADIVAFGISGLGVWEHYVSSTSPANMSGTEFEDATSSRLGETWGFMENNCLNTIRIRPEAIEALVDTTVQLAAFMKEVPKLTAASAQIILKLLARFSPQPDVRLKSALAVAVTFWGLSLEDQTWIFWMHKTREEYWGYYMDSTKRKEDTAALLLIGLSRILAHHSRLQLSYASIYTIAHEVHDLMKGHSGCASDLALKFLSPISTYDVRRHVRGSIWRYLEETEIYGPFSRSANELRELLRTAVSYDGGEGYAYEQPQPFAHAESAPTYIS